MNKTRYKTLGYRQDAPGLWRFYDLADNREAAVGPHYTSKAELLADLTRYAADYGLEPSSTTYQKPVADESIYSHLMRLANYCTDRAGQQDPNVETRAALSEMAAKLKRLAHGHQARTLQIYGE